MPRIFFRTPSSQTASAVWSSLVLALPALAQTLPIQEGRPAAPLPGDTTGERYYERKRIKRTVSLEPTAALTATWDLLYAGLPGEPLKAVYFSWDDTYLYLATQTTSLLDVRFELDGSGDGWFRGAENLSLRLVPTTDASGARVLMRRFDTLQNSQTPVWALSPIPEERVLARMGKSGEDTYATVALPLSELFSLKRKPGTELALRVAVGEQALLDTTPEQPFLRLILADEVEATHQSLQVRLLLRGRQLVPGQPVRGSVDVANLSQKPIFLKRYFLPDGSTLDDPKNPALIVNPGEHIRREFRFVPATGEDPKSFVLRGGVEREEGGSLIALASLQQLDPYELDLDLDTRPIPAGAPAGSARQRLVAVVIRSRKDGKTEGKLKLTLPEGWSAEGELSRSFTLSYGPESKTLSFKVRVPVGTPAGSHPIEVHAEIGGRPYHAAAALTVK